MRIKVTQLVFGVFSFNHGTIVGAGSPKGSLREAGSVLHPFFLHSSYHIGPSLGLASCNMKAGWWMDEKCFLNR
jgi:hypothetical protein